MVLAVKPPPVKCFRGKWRRQELELCFFWATQLPLPRKCCVKALLKELTIYHHQYLPSDWTCLFRIKLPAQDLEMKKKSSFPSSYDSCISMYMLSLQSHLPFTEFLFLSLPLFCFSHLSFFLKCCLVLFVCFFPVRSEYDRFKVSNHE